MPRPKKITVEALRSLIAEAMNEDDSIEDASDQENIAQSNEDMAAAEDDERAANESMEASDEVILERWRKLAGIIKS